MGSKWKSKQPTKSTYAKGGFENNFAKNRKKADAKKNKPYRAPAKRRNPPKKKYK